MLGRSWVVVLALLVSPTACEREPRTEDAAPVDGRAGDGGGQGSSPSGTQPSFTPWGIAREREREAEELTRRAREEMAAIERKQAELEREQAELARAAAERAAAEHRARLGPPAPVPAPMSPSGPESAPMSRPEPEPTMLAAPPLAYTLRAEAPLSHQGPQPKLELRRVVRNGITDMDAWFLGHGLSLPTWMLPSPTPFGTTRPGSSGDPLPAEIPTKLAGFALTEAIRGADHSIAFYSTHGGDSVVVRDAIGDSLGAFGFAAWPPDQQPQWAQVQDGVLFLCTYHMTYASSTAGKNAFITAIALRTGELLWQSEPLVCNTWNFLLRDGWIISGYGFTAEPDFLYVLDAKTGEVAQRKPLKSGPEVILEKGGMLYVRTYDRDYELAIR